MLPESRWLLPFLLTFACDGVAEPQLQKSPPSQMGAEAKEEPSGAAKDPVADAPASAEVIEEWLVWFDAGSGVQSRWYTSTEAGTTATAQRSALAVAAGDALWHVRRNDASADVFACECFESEKAPACRKNGSVRTLGLEAAPIGGGAAVALLKANTDRIYGDVDGVTLSLRGGVGARLMLETTDAGYYCGAHGSHGGAGLSHEKGE